MKVKRKIIQIDEELCDGCGNCVPSCAEGSLEIIDGKARVISDNLCDGLGACLGECPQGALSIVDREAEEFDEAAVEKHLEEQKQAHPSPQPMPMAGGCPSAQIQNFGQPTPCQAANAPVRTASEESALTHWPVQIRLIPPTAPFLKHSDLLVVADCVPVSFADFHGTFLKGKTVAMGCPKFDDAQAYIEKFAQIFQTAELNSITTVVMEVPCCAGLPMIVKKGMELSGVKVPMEEVVITTRGKILASQKVA